MGGVEIAGLENAGNDIVWKTMYYLCLLQSTKCSSHRVSYCLLRPSRRLVYISVIILRSDSLVKWNTALREIPKGRGFVYAHAKQMYEHQIGADTAVACSHVRLIGVDISFDLSLDHHVSCICAGCYYRLRQLRRIRRSLDSDSLATLVYAVVNSRIHYCNTVLAGAPRVVMDKLQRVLNAAARVVTGTRKFDRGLGQILHDELHWLDVPDRVFFKLAVIVHWCLNGRAPLYPSDY